MYSLLFRTGCFVGRAFFPVLAIGAVVAAIVIAASKNTETEK